MRTILVVDYDRRSITIAGEGDAYFHASIRLGLNNIEGALPMAITITVTQQFTAAVRAVDVRGNPARLDGPLAWEVSDPARLTLTVSPEGVATVAAAGPVGAAQLRVSGDADLGDGVRQLTGILDVEVVAGEAVTLTIEPSTPTEQA